jgi:hypothetical protein
MSLKEYIHQQRPSLSASSLTTYNSILSNLYKKIFGELPKEQKDFDKFNETEKFIHFLKDIDPSKRKTTLSALVVLTDNKKYKELMLEDISHYNKEMSHQEKSESQKENWLSEEEIKQVYNNLKSEADSIYKSKQTNMFSIQKIQNYIILSLLGGIFIPVRRSLDFCDMKKAGQIDKKKDNYIDWKKNKFVFNIFKTAKWYGTQELDIPPELRKILLKWVKLSPHTDWFLFDQNSNPLTSVKLNQRFQSIFGKKASVNLLRHSYLTKLYGKHMEEKKEMEQTAEDMGTSAHMVENVYVKK